MLRDVLAAITGIAVAIITVMLIQMLGHVVFPPPADLNMEDTEAMRTYVRSIPVAALLFVLASYLIAAFDGTLVACLIGHARPAYFALVVAVLMLVGTVTNLIMIPHPAWFAVASVAGIVAAAAVASWLGGRVRSARAGAA